MTTQRPTIEEIISLLDKNDLQQLQVVLDKISEDTPDIVWGFLMRHASAIGSVDGIQLVVNKFQDLYTDSANLNFLHVCWKAALGDAHSTAMAHLILDEIQSVEPDFGASEAFNSTIRHLTLNGGVDALTVVAQRVNLTPAHLKTGMIAAIEIKSMEMSLVFAELMNSDEHNLSHSLIHAGIHGFEPLIDHLYTLERAHKACDWYRERGNVSFDTTMIAGVAYLYQKMMADLSKQEMEHHVDGAVQQPSKMSKM